MTMDRADARKKDLQGIKETAERQGSIPKEILETLPIGICLTDKEGKFSFVNTRYTDIYGYQRDELIGRHFTTVVPDAQQDEMMRRHDKFIADKSKMEGIWEVQRKNGERFQIQANDALVEPNRSEGPFKMTFVVDITDIYSATDHLNATVEILNRKLEAQELSRHASDHDLRNNLINISQMAQILRDTELDEQQQRWVEIIYKLSQRTLDVLRVSGDFHKMEQGAYTLDLSSFDLLQTLLVQTEAYAKERKHRQIDIETLREGHPADFSAQALRIEADQPYIERLFANLIGNAVEASADQSAVRINVSTQDCLRISIHNRGVVLEDIRDTFFEKFATSGKRDGTGLGTYIAKLITDLHDGRIYFDTSSKEGTTVTVDFPPGMIQ